MPTVWSNILHRTIDRWSDDVKPPELRCPLLEQPWFRAALDSRGIKSVLRIEHDYNHCQIIIHIKNEPPLQVPDATLYAWHIEHRSQPEPELPKLKRLIKI
jgi:hypothetical protein